MALSVTTVDSGANDTDGTSFLTASKTPTANALQLLAVARRVSSGGLGTVSVSGCGLTWVAVRTEANLTVFRALGASPTTGQLTITTSLTNICVVYSWVEVTGCDTSGTNGSGAIVQSNGNNVGTSGTSIATTLSARSNAGNILYEGTATRANNAITHPTSWTEIHDLGTSTDTQRAETAWYNADDTAPGTSFAASSNRAIVALEIKVAPVALTGSGAAADSAAGSLTRSAGLTGSGSSAASATGTATVARALTASAPSSASASADLSTARPLAASASSASSATGELSVTRGIAANGNAAASANGTLDTARALTGMAPASSSATGELTVEGINEVAFDGMAPASASATGTLAVARALTGAGAAAASASGVLTRAAGLEASASAASSATGVLSVATSAEAEAARRRARIVNDLPEPEEWRPFLVGAPRGLVRLPDIETWWGDE